MASIGRRSAMWPPHSHAVTSPAALCGLLICHSCTSPPCYSIEPPCFTANQMADVAGGLALLIPSAHELASEAGLLRVAERLPPSRHDKWYAMLLPTCSHCPADTQVLDFDDAGLSAAEAPTPQRTAPRLLSQQLWASVDSPDEETPCGTVRRWTLNPISP